MNIAIAPAVALTDEDGDVVRLEDGGNRAEVGFISAARRGHNLDRERAVTLIEALTARVEALDALDAAAAMLKRGDIVYGVGWGTFLVLTDEVAGRNFDVAVLDTGGSVSAIYTVGEIIRYSRLQVTREPRRP